MPAPNPTKELIARESLRQLAYGPVADRWQYFNPLHLPIGTQAELDPSTVNQAALRVYTNRDKDFIVVGTNAAAGTAGDDGGVNIVTAGADNDEAFARPATVNSGSTAVGAFSAIDLEPEHELRMECLVELPSIADVVAVMGFVLDPTAADDLTTDANQAKLRFSTEGSVSTTNWTACTSIAGTDVETDTGIAVAADTAYKLEIRTSALRVPTFWINGALVHTGGALTAGTDFLPCFGVKALTGSAKTLRVRYAKISRVYR